MAFRLAARNLLKRTVQPPRIARTITPISRAAHPRAISIPTSLGSSLRQFSSSTRTPQQIRYVRFGDGGGPKKNRWIPFKDGKWDTPSKILVGVTGAGGVYYVYHLERVEETGRWRFIDVSPEKEREYGREADQEVLKEFAGKILPASDPLVRRITNVASRIITAANLGEVKGASSSNQLPAQAGGWSILPTSSEGAFGGDDASTAAWDMTPAQRSVAERLRQEWEVYVIKDDKTPNAFVTGGGKIFVFTGIVPVAANDDGLATVIGHEIAHQVQRHSAEKLSGAKVFGALVILLEILGLDVGLSRLGLTLLMSLPNSRAMESEADNVGLRLMAQACFDPRESVRMWERMSEIEKQQRGGGLFSFGGGDFLQTHPANEKRILALQQWIPNALSVRAASSCAIDDHRTVGDEFRAFQGVFGSNSGSGRSIWA
ncbi:hypothetical protein FS837_005847 [Tulasnella sp. UAMH 9824]|nr:hypothetical protein FS837_005847 [Tulasnella sp. UAMH 9824]